MKRRERSIVSGLLAGLCFIAAVVHPGPVLAAESDGPEAEEAAAEEVDMAWTELDEALAAFSASAAPRMRLMAAAPGTTSETEQVVVDRTGDRVTYSTQCFNNDPNFPYGTGHYSANGVEYSMYCASPDIPDTPAMGSTVTAYRLTDSTMRKLLYYGYMAPGYNASKEVRDLYDSLDYSEFSRKDHYTYCHLALGLAYHGVSGRGNWTTGLSANVINNVRKLYNGLTAMPNPPAAFETWLIPHATDNHQDMVYWKPLKTGDAYLVKISANSGTAGNGNYSLEGAVYGVYSDAACTAKVETLTTGKDGKSNTVTLIAGTYYVKETAAPKNFRMDTAVHTMTVNAGGTAKVSVTDEPYTTPTTLIKTTSDGGTMPLTGTVYTVFRDADCTDQAGRLTVKEDGTSNTLQLLYGTYYVKETKAAYGYKVDDTVTKITLGNTDTCTLKFTDRAIRAGVYLEKWDEDLSDNQAQGSASLKGTTVVIRNENDYSVFLDDTLYAKGEVVLTLTSDEEGVMKSAEDSLQCGSYSFEETTSPSGYDMGSVISGSFTIEPEDEGTLKELTGNGPKDPVKRAGVLFDKLDHELDERTAQGDAALSGAVIEITNENDNPVYVNGQSYEKGAVCLTLFTGEDGTVATDPDALPIGDYSWKEIKAPEGYLLSGTTEGSFTLTEDEAGTVKDLTGNGPKDDVIRGGVKIVKFDKELDTNESLGGATLEGIEFTITNASKQRVLVLGEVYGKGEVVARLVTDEEGSASLPEDALPYGTYTIQETKTNESYLLTDGEARTFEIREDGVTVSADVDGGELIFRDQVIRNDIHFNKISDTSNARMQSIPFKVTNTVTGETHVVVTDRNGTFNSGALSNPHTVKTNANDGALEGYGEDTVIKTADLDAKAGVWFGLGRKGSTAKADDSLGAFPFGEYTVEELRCENNEGYDLISIVFYIDEDTTAELPVDLGTLTNDDLIPEIFTVALDSKTKDHLASSSDAQIIDTVHCVNLVPGKSYVLKAELVDESGKAVKDGRKKVTGEQVFKAEAVIMDVEVVLGSFDPAAYEGQTVTVYEKLYEKRLIGTGRLLTSHEELEDEDQQIRIPKIRTNAADELTGSHAGSYGNKVTVKDVVTFSNLIPEKEYTVTGTLHDKETGEAIRDSHGREITDTCVFTPSEAEGRVELSFVLDSTLLGGRTVVAFESLMYGGVEIAAHADSEDANQSVYYPEIYTTLADPKTGSHEVVADAKVTLTDEVTYENLVADGRSYVMTGMMILKDGEEYEILMENGKPVKSTVTFKPESASGKVAVSFTLNASSLAGCRVVAFEECADAKTGAVVAIHKDMNDEDQTVVIKEKPAEPTPTPVTPQIPSTPSGESLKGDGTITTAPVKTGDSSRTILWIALMCAAGTAGILVAKKRLRK